MVMNEEISMDAPLWRCILKKTENTTKNILKCIVKPVAVLAIIIAIIYAALVYQSLVLNVISGIISFIVSILLTIHPLVYVGIFAVLLLIGHSTYWCMSRKLDHVDWSSNSAEISSIITRIVSFVIVIMFGMLGFTWSMSPLYYNSLAGFTIFMASFGGTIISIVLLLIIPGNNKVYKVVGAYLNYCQRMKNVNEYQKMNKGEME